MPSSFWQINLPGEVIKLARHFVAATGVSTLFSINLNWLHYLVHDQHMFVCKEVFTITGSGTKRFYLVYPSSTAGVKAHFGWTLKVDDSAEIRIYKNSTADTPGVACVFLNHYHGSATTLGLVVKPDTGTPTPGAEIVDEDWAEVANFASSEVGTAFEHVLEYSAADEPYLIEIESKSASVKCLLTMAAYEPDENL